MPEAMQCNACEQTERGGHTGKPKWMSAASVRTLREEEIAMKATPPILDSNYCLNSELNFVQLLSSHKSNLVLPRFR